MPSTTQNFTFQDFLYMRRQILISWYSLLIQCELERPCICAALLCLLFVDGLKNTRRWINSCQKHTEIGFRNGWALLLFQGSYLVHTQLIVHYRILFDSVVLKIISKSLWGIFQKIRKCEGLSCVFIQTKMFSRYVGRVCSQIIMNIAVSQEVCKVILKSIPTLRPSWYTDET